MNLIRRFWIKGSIVTYAICVLSYNFFGKPTLGWTDWYYTYEKGFAFLSTMWSIEKHTLSDRLFIDFARITQCGTWMFFILCSFNSPTWVYHQTAIVSTIIIACFGSILAQYYIIRSRL